MGWRFHRVLSAGLMRLNLSRTGVGWSCGIPGLRYGVSATGRRYVTLGFPGLGLYWMKYLSPSTLHQPTPSLGPTGVSTGSVSHPSASVGAPSATTSTGSGSSAQNPWWKQGRP